MTGPEPILSATSPAFSPLADVRERMAQAARIAQRQIGEITLVAVSKTHEAPAIRPLIAQGQRVFGENRVQEAEAKWPALREECPDIALHLVGQLQSNKAEDAVRLFDVIHSLDRPSLLTALARAMDKTGRRVPCSSRSTSAPRSRRAAAQLPTCPPCWAKRARPTFRCWA
jgi:uncharacterized pyridoxal phosphate-containing UPF0001 family protein